MRWPGSFFLGGQVKAEVFGETKSYNQMVVFSAETVAVKHEDGRNFLVIVAEILQGSENSSSLQTLFVCFKYKSINVSVIF